MDEFNKLLQIEIDRENLNYNGSILTSNDDLAIQYRLLRQQILDSSKKKNSGGLIKRILHFLRFGY